MNEMFKYKTNDEVWVMHENKPQLMYIKDCLLSIPSKPNPRSIGKFLEGNARIRYTTYSICALNVQYPCFEESDIFKTKDELIQSLYHETRQHQ